MSIIRASRSYLFDLISSQNQRLNTNMHKLTEQAVTGRRINRPSDSPTEIGRVVRIREELANQEGFKQNVGWSQSLLGTADAVIGEGSNIMKRSHEIAVAMANDTYSATDRQAAALEVDALREELIRIGNTEIADRYIFAGNGYDEPPFDAAGSYTGSTDTPDTLIGDDVWVQTGWDGSDVFQSGVDVFQVLDDLSLALNANDADQVGVLIGDVGTGLEQIIGAHQSVGWAYAQADDYLVLSEKMEAELSGRLGALVNADSAEVYLNLQEAQSAYGAALQVATSGMNLSLFSQI
jgi:flagellar hook-associated protein 3 FlgL